MKSRKASTTLIEKLFSSVPPEQKINALIHKLDQFKKYYEANPDNDVIRDAYIELHCQCGDLCMENKEYEHAKQYYDKAYSLTQAEHYLKHSLSSKLLIVTENIMMARLI